MNFHEERWEMAVTSIEQVVHTSTAKQRLQYVSRLLNLLQVLTASPVGLEGEMPIEHLDIYEKPACEKIAVLVVDDHPIFLEGLKKVLGLADDIEIVGQSNDGENAIEMLIELEPDVVLLDVNLPDMNGLQVTSQVKQSNLRTKIVIMTAYHDDQQTFHALRAGASAYLSKDFNIASLLTVIRDVARGLYVVNGQRMDEGEIKHWIENKVVAEIGTCAIDPADYFAPLSPREMEILQYVAQGLSNREVALKTSISYQTVKNHMSSILKKLNVQDRTQAAITALRHGWVQM